MAKIKTITASEILDSRGNPTVEVTVALQDGSIGIASCPSGASVGSNEALELRDNDTTRFHGMGVLRAIKNIQDVITPKLIGVEASQQQDVDKILIELDGTADKSKLGANATLPVSIAVAKAEAKSEVLPVFMYLRKYVRTGNTALKVPTPLFNIINGGKHAENTLNFQEFIIIPASFKSYDESLRIGTHVYQTLKGLLKTNHLSTLIGDEGGFGPALNTNADALVLLKQAITASNLRPGFDVFLGLDAAATSFYTNHQYRIKDNPSALSADALIDYYEKLNNSYHLLYLEDPLAEEEWDDWQRLSKKISHNTIIVGDDLTVTNPYRLQMALDKKAITGIIIKPNQIGTVIETIAVVEIARTAGLKIIVSHRSGETNDDFIADLAVAASSDYVKFGAPARGERVEKYNRLWQIDRQLRALEGKHQ